MRFSAPTGFSIWNSAENGADLRVQTPSATLVALDRKPSKTIVPRNAICSNRPSAKMPAADRCRAHCSRDLNPRRGRTIRLAR